MFGLHVPFARSGAGEPPFLQLRIMDEYANLPHIPDDDGEAGGPAHGPFGHQPGHLPDFTDNMLAQMDPALATPANFAQGAVLIRTWYIHHETHQHCAIPRMSTLAVIVLIGSNRLSMFGQTSLTLTFPRPSLCLRQCHIVAMRTSLLPLT